MFSKSPTTVTAFFLAALAWSASAHAEIDLAATKAEAALIEAGRKVAVAGDCIACHTVPGGKPYAGGLAMETPIGTIYSTNITPDATTGIGPYSYDDFAAALRRGVAKDGHNLYPAMPYPSYARVSDADMRALYAYFMDGVDAVDQPNRGSDIPWPLSMRWPLGVWNMAFAPGEAVKAVSIADRGAYLVEGLGHCGSCHTPRGIAFQEKALSAADGPQFLGGGMIDGWFAKSLRNDVGHGMGDWSEDELVEFLKTGRNARTAAFGGMTEVITHSTQAMDEADLRAMARSLKALSAAGPTYVAKGGDTAFDELRQGKYARRGATLYAEFCQSCHRADGQGVPRIYPALAGNSAVLPDNPASTIRVALAGGRMPVTDHGPTAFAMPGFSRLSDAELADVLSFVRGAWGNNAPAVNASEVAKTRKAFPILPARP
ncbi:alcohol dehydrogenase [Paramagnetospirillum kuznetsovii]|uniref:Alcohol dehydrogenase n=1 Tax=Paramagnetospirillum kuznetsovii TaxID=2053833 RepID=A0A364NT24_9PROT|nr:cytochrome c [Paramagnetospirillum kuznetsovii]RAU20233.1 alcohol dehydrogenase [Paramagnetospirillum kuznetsovii]